MMKGGTQKCVLMGVMFLLNAAYLVPGFSQF